MSSSSLATYRSLITGAEKYSKIATSDEDQQGDPGEGPTWRRKPDGGDQRLRANTELREGRQDGRPYLREQTAKLNLVCNRASTGTAVHQHRIELPTKGHQISLQATSRHHHLKHQHRQHEHAALKLIRHTLLILCLQQYLTRNLKESLASPAPSSFLDSGHPVPCTTGQPVKIRDHIPVSDSSYLERCYTCSCPGGKVVCSQSPEPNCALKAAPSKSPPHAANRFSSGVGGNRASPTATLALHPTHNGHHLNPYHTHNNHHHNNHQSKSPIGKAKPFLASVGPLKMGKMATTGSGQPQQQPSVASALLTPRQAKHFVGAHGGSRPTIFNRQQQDDLDLDEQSETVAQDELEVRRVVHSPRAASSQSYHREPEILQAPRLPPDHQEHHVIAAEALGMSLEKYSRKRDKLLNEARARTSTTQQLPIETTTTTTTTTPLPVPTEEETILSEDNLGEQDKTGETDSVDDEEVELTTTTTTTNGLYETQTNTNPTTEFAPTTTSQPPLPSSVSITDDWPVTSAPPSQLPEWPQPSPENQLDIIERDPAVVVHGQGVLIKPGLDAIPQNPDGTRNKIDYDSANTLMEQVSHDGMLYIAIAVEAFILLSIISMMIVFYCLRHKTPEELLDQHHHLAIQMPSRSPSLEKA